MNIAYEEAVELIQSDAFQSGEIFIGVSRIEFFGNYVLYADQNGYGAQRINRHGEVYKTPITLEESCGYTKYDSFVEAVVDMFSKEEV